MSVFKIDSFRGGLADYEDKGIPGSFKFGSNLDIRKKKDSLSCQQDLVDEGLRSSQSPSASPSPSASISASPSVSESASVSATASFTPSSSPSVSKSASPSVTPSSSISPSPSPTKGAGVTTVFEGLIHTFVKGSDGYTYGFDNTGCIYKRDADAFWQRVYKDADGAILGAEEEPSETGKIYLCWATKTKVKRKPISGLSNWNDVEVIAQNLRSEDWHTMKQVGGAVYIANGPFLALVGYDSSFTNEALDLIPGNTAKTLVERNGRVVIGAVKTSDPDNGINGAIDAEVPLSQVGNDGDLYFANGTDSIPVKSFPGGGKVNPGGVCNEIDPVNFFEWEETALSWIGKQTIGNLALFAVYGADSGRNGIYSYGRKNKNHPSVMNLEYQLEADELGAIVNVNGTTLVSYRDGAEFGVKAVSKTVKATGTYEGIDLKAPVKKPGNITNWKYIEMFCSPIVNGTSIEFWYKMNKTGEFIQAKMEGEITQFSLVGEMRAVFLIGAEGYILEPRIVLNPTGNTSPEVNLSLIHFD